MNPSLESSIEAFYFLFDIKGGADFLEIPVELRIDELTVFLDVGKKTYLNFNDLKLIGTGGSLVGTGADVVCALRHESDTSRVIVYDPALSNEYHSDYLDRPFFTLKFRHPEFVSSIRLTNRAGRFGHRLIPMRVSGSLAGDEIFRFENCSEARFVGQMKILSDKFKAVAFLSEFIGRNQKFAKLASSVFCMPYQNAFLESGLVTLVEFKSEILSEVSKGPVPSAQAGNVIDFLLSLVNRVGSQRPMQVDIELLALAHSLAIDSKIELAGSDLGSYLVSWNFFYQSAMELINFQGLIQKWHKACGFKGVPVLAKHGWRVAPLRSNVYLYISLLEEIFSALKKNGRHYFLSYGTLLGAVRAGGFIDYDDDVDIGMVVEVDHDDEVRSALLEVCSALRGSGIDAEYREQYRIIQVTCPGLPTSIDIFPCCLHRNFEPGREMRMHHREMKFEYLNMEIVLPIGQVTLEGKCMPAPARPADFLAWRYGSGWTVSDQFFEMAWVFNY